MRRISHVFLCLVAVVLTTVPLYADDCSALLQAGIYDIRSSRSLRDTAQSFSNWFCSQQFSSAEQADSFGANIGFPFKGIPVKLGFNSNQESWSQWYSQFCQDVRSEFRERVQMEEYVQTVNSTIVNGFNSCINAQGLHVWLEFQPDSRSFAFAAKFVTPTANVRVAKLTSFKVTPNAVKCSPRVAGRGVGPATFRSLCSRPTDDPVQVIVNSDFDPQGSPTLTLAALKPSVISTPVGQIESRLTKLTPPVHNPRQVSGCDCGTNTVTTDPITLNVHVNDWAKFNWDVSWLCRGQGIKDSPEGEGYVWWNGRTAEKLPGMYGTAEVKYPAQGSYPVSLNYSAVCWDTGYGGPRCVQGVRCDAKGSVTINVAP